MAAGSARFGERERRPGPAARFGSARTRQTNSHWRAELRPWVSDTASVDGLGTAHNMTTAHHPSIHIHSPPSCSYVRSPAVRLRPARVTLATGAAKKTRRDAASEMRTGLVYLTCQHHALEDAISRLSSYIFSKCEEKASTGHNMQRLEMAHNELEFALERTGKLPITDVSLLRRRKILKRSFEECSDVLHRCKILIQEDEEIEQEPTVTHSSYPKRIARATKSSISYLFATGKDASHSSDVQRFEWLADCAGKFVRDVESGCSLRHHTFCSPLLRQLLEGKTLRYKKKVQGNQLRDICIWPTHLEDRGIEAVLMYHYEDYKMPEKKFQLCFMLRLSESTDIIGIAMNCLRYLAFQFKLVAEPVMGELTLLSDLHDISHSYAPPWVGFPETYTLLTHLYRPDPICCKPSEHEKSTTDMTSSEFPNKFPEEVISISLRCRFHNSTDDKTGRKGLIDWSPHMYLRVGFAPHAVSEGQSYETKIAGRRLERRVGSVEQDIEMVKSKTLDCLVRQSDVVSYTTSWQYVHGTASFKLQSRAIPWINDFGSRPKTHRDAERKRYILRRLMQSVHARALRSSGIKRRQQEV